MSPPSVHDIARAQAVASDRVGAPLIWRLRRASVADAGALAIIGTATFLETYAGFINGAALLRHCRRAHSEAAYRRWLAEGNVAFLGEAQGGAPIGYALLTSPDLPQAVAGDVELRRIYVLARAAGTGLGTALCEAVIAAATGHRRLLLGTHPSNRRAIAFYRRFGFATIGERRFIVGGQHFDDIVMAKTLTAPTAATAMLSAAVS